MELAYNESYTHKVKEGAYRITDLDAEVKIDGKWLPAVVYKKKYSEEKKKYIRTVDDFTENFNTL